MEVIHNVIDKIKVVKKEIKSLEDKKKIRIL